MALKTFNVDGEIHKKFAEYCKKEGISMSKKIENFIRQEVERIFRGADSDFRANKNKGVIGKGSIMGVKGNIIGEHPLRKYC